MGLRMQLVADTRRLETDERSTAVAAVTRASIRAAKGRVAMNAGTNARYRGFTLIELLVVVAIVAILASVAIPAYTGQMRKSRRSEAHQVLTDLALKQEKWRALNSTYGTLAQIGGTSPTPSGNYTIGAITYAPAGGNCPGTATAVSSANSFVITATASGAQASDNACDTLVITNYCGTITKSSTPAGGDCW